MLQEEIRSDAMLQEEMIQPEYEKKGYLKETYRLFYLKDQEPKEYENHYHEFDKIIFCISGTVRYTIEGKSYDLLPNDIVLVHNGDVHKVLISNDTPYERIVFYLSPNRLSKYDYKSFHIDECFQLAKKRYSNVIRTQEWKQNHLYQTAMLLKDSLLRENSQDDEYLYRKTLFLQFMIHLNRAMKEEQVIYVDTLHCNRKIVEIIRYINEHLTEEMKIETLASGFYISKYHMMRLFKAETGYTIGNYINHKRLLYARGLLLQGESVTQACFLSGFQDHSTFSRAYKQLFGVTPVKSRLL